MKGMEYQSGAPPQQGVGVQLRIEFTPNVWEKIQAVSKIMETEFPSMVIELLLSAATEICEMPEDAFDSEEISYECDFINKM